MLSKAAIVAVGSWLVAAAVGSDAAQVLHTMSVKYCCDSSQTDLRKALDETTDIISWIPTLDDLAFFNSDCVDFASLSVTTDKNDDSLEVVPKEFFNTMVHEGIDEIVGDIALFCAGIEAIALLDSEISRIFEELPIFLKSDFQQFAKASRITIRRTIGKFTSRGYSAIDSRDEALPSTKNFSIPQDLIFGSRFQSKGIDKVYATDNDNTAGRGQVTKTKILEYFIINAWGEYDYETRMAEYVYEELEYKKNSAVVALCGSTPLGDTTPTSYNSKNAKNVFTYHGGLYKLIQLLSASEQPCNCRTFSVLGVSFKEYEEGPIWENLSVVLVDVKVAKSTITPVATKIFEHIKLGEGLQQLLADAFRNDQPRKQRIRNKSKNEEEPSETRKMSKRSSKKGKKQQSGATRTRSKPAPPTGMVQSAILRAGLGTGLMPGISAAAMRSTRSSSGSTSRVSEMLKRA